MARPKEIDDNIAKHNWKLLLYPDNPVHVAVMDEIERLYPDDFIYCQHKMWDDSGNVITSGQGKLHVHYALDTVKDIRRGSLCKKLGLIDPDSGLPDSRFLLPVYGKMSEWLPYLTHINSPDKYHYAESDLVGAPRMLQMYHVAALDCVGKALTVRECLQACISWVRSHEKRVSYTDYAQWIIATPYFRCRNERLIWAVIDEHNQKIAQSELELIQSSYDDYPPAQIEQKVSGGSKLLYLGGRACFEDEFEEI